MNSLSRVGSVCALILAVLFLSSCASAPPRKKEMPLPKLEAKEIESEKRAKAKNEKIFTAMVSTRRAANSDYKIGAEDLVEISVFEDEKLNKTVRVSSQGNISLPLLGVLRVGGLTANQLEREIRDLLSEKYFHNPNVSVFIREYRNQRISVIGMVEKPGVYDVTGQKTVLHMLSLAGGLKEDAGQLLFLIHSPLSEEGIPERQKESPEQAPQTLVISLDEILVKGDLSANVPVSHGDVINIPASGKVFVGGAVVKPGGFPLKGKKITASQGIAMAEGLKLESDGSQARIFRFSGKENEKEAISVNILAIQDGVAEDPYLEENDILIVPKSFTKNFLITLRDSVKGFLGFSIFLNPIF